MVNSLSEVAQDQRQWEKNNMNGRRKMSIDKTIYHEPAASIHALPEL